jgi:hypothetical protein
LENDSYEEYETKINELNEKINILSVQIKELNTKLLYLKSYVDEEGEKLRNG